MAEGRFFHTALGRGVVPSPFPLNVPVLPVVSIFWSDEDGGYIVNIPDLEVCSAFGTTPAQALAEVERAKGAWLEAARTAGKRIPAPRAN